MGASMSGPVIRSRRREGQGFAGCQWRCAKRSRAAGAVPGVSAEQLPGQKAAGAGELSAAGRPPNPCEATRG